MAGFSDALKPQFEALVRGKSSLRNSRSSTSSRFYNRAPKHQVPLPRLLIAGRHLAGKDTMADWLRNHTWLQHPGSASMVLLPYVAAEKLDIDVEHARNFLDEEVLAGIYDRRHDECDDWKSIANKVRDEDVTALVGPLLDNGELLVGIRDPREVEWSKRKEADVALRIWVENPRVGHDPTMEFGQSACDITIVNDGTLADFYAKILRLVELIGIPMYTIPLSDHD